MKPPYYFTLQSNPRLARSVVANTEYGEETRTKWKEFIDRKPNDPLSAIMLEEIVSFEEKP